MKPAKMASRPLSRQVDESEFITPSEVGKAKELAGSGFADSGSF